MKCALAVGVPGAAHALTVNRHDAMNAARYACRQ